MEELRAKKKWKVIDDPYSLFANIETIKQSMDEAAKVGELAKENERTGEIEALRGSRALGKMKMESSMFESQL